MAQTTENRQALLDQSIRSLIPRMAMPPIIAQLITKVYNLVDTFFVSTLGTAATAAVGVNTSLEHTITMFAGLIGSGACSYIARLLGEKRGKDADRVLSTSFFAGLALGVLFAVFGTIFITPLMRLLSSNADSEVYAIQYGTYVLLASPFMIGSFILNMCLRSEGRSTYAMVGIAAGGVLNCFLDPLFIYTFGLGVSGASMATAISKAVSFFILLWPYIRKQCSVVISVKKIRLVAKDAQDVLSVGSTTCLRSVCNVLSSVLINRIAGTFSTAALAAVSVTNRILDFPFAVTLGFTQGCQPIIGFNWGAKRLDRVKETLRTSMKVAVIGSLVFGALLFAFAQPLVHIFNQDGNGQVLRLGVLCTRLQCLTLIIHSMESVLCMFYSGTGKAKYSLLMATARQGYCFIPVILTIPFLFEAEGVAACQSISDLLMLAVAVPLGVKVTRIIKRKEAEIHGSC